jgi:hypothetical protein
MQCHRVSDVRDGPLEGSCAAGHQGVSGGDTVAVQFDGPNGEVGRPPGSGLSDCPDSLTSATARFAFIEWS